MDIKKQNYFFNLRTGCYEKFSTKYTLVFKLRSRIFVNNYNGLLNLMSENNNKINKKNNNKIKF